MPKTFTLWFTAVSWVDGDTVKGSLDHGCRIYTGTPSKPIRFRCALINAPELSTAAGPIALAYAQNLVPPGEYQCASLGLDEYGRPLIDLVLKTGGWFSAAMLAAGQAVPYP